MCTLICPLNVTAQESRCQQTDFLHERKLYLLSALFKVHPLKPLVRLRLFQCHPGDDFNGFFFFSRRRPHNLHNVIAPRCSISCHLWFPRRDSLMNLFHLRRDPHRFASLARRREGGREKPSGSHGLKRNRLSGSEVKKTKKKGKGKKKKSAHLAVLAPNQRVSLCTSHSSAGASSSPIAMKPSPTTTHSAWPGGRLSDWHARVPGMS